MAKSKWLRIGQVKLAKRKDGSEFESMELDNESLCEFLGLLKKFGAEKIGDMTVDQIRTAQKLRKDDPAHLPRIRIARFDKTDEDYAGSNDRKGCPTWILADLLVDVEQFN